MSKIRIGLVGIGKIARDQHIPALNQSETVTLAAAASRHSSIEGLDMFPDLETMLAKEPGLDAVSLCTPPQERYRLARLALDAGKHLMLEKPPGATLSEVIDLRNRAAAAGLTLFATWHARFAPGVEPARAWIADRKVKSVKIDWREDVRHWHPGQEWIWEPGGLGVLDPGINALSIATRILPQPFLLSEAVLRFPENRQAPISGDMSFVDADGVPIQVGLDWLQTGPQTWDIRVETDAGVLVLSKGGAVMSVDGEVVLEEPDREYPRLYERFGRLIAEKRSDVDVSPFRHVSDIFLKGRREIVEPFVE